MTVHLEVGKKHTRVELVQALLATSLRMMGWLLLNALVAIGAVSLVAFVVGGCSFEGLMHQLANLSTRYIAADLGRQHQFNSILIWIVSGTFCLTGFFRRHSLFDLLFKEFDRVSATA
ncbi:hypothetical protein HT136_24720 [Novosphingobium profundi]|uniref:hypothetical protein n=1 Tax=Novosphingobium profundi TaxID=1774954 RepID=UPI001BD9FF0D|nr:hypothetical protein [Novosphingobium profundi]MBT0671578.1 hypothetical protein [Novosphingobium profundi]